MGDALRWRISVDVGGTQLQFFAATQLTCRQVSGNNCCGGYCLHFSIFGFLNLFFWLYGAMCSFGSGYGENNAGGHAYGHRETTGTDTDTHTHR